LTLLYSRAKFDEEVGIMSKKQERMLHVWADEVGKVHVSIAHRTEEELRRAYDWKPGKEELLLELPFRLRGAEAFSEELPERYYAAILGLLELTGVAAVVETLLTDMVRLGFELARHRPPRSRKIQ
jgi:hypothetical protein